MLVAAAALFGLAGGYGWSVLNAPHAKLPPHPKAAFMPIPPSPEEQPAASDVQWTAEADDQPASVHYSGCNEVRAAGKAPLNIGEPGYRSDMDGDGDGVACEPVRAR